MKIRIPVVASKAFEAPEFLRPYIAGEKDWDEMDYEEDRAYIDWYNELIKKETIIEDAGWNLVED